MSYYAAVDDIAAKLAPTKGDFCKDPGDIPTWVAPADLCGDHGLVQVYPYALAMAGLFANTKNA